MSSFLDSMIPRDTVSNMNQFDFVVDIVEKKDKFHLSGELPGCNVSNVDVKIDKENNLHISAMKSIKHEEDEQSPDGTVKWHAIERSSGKVERIFALPEGRFGQNQLLHERRRAFDGHHEETRVLRRTQRDGKEGDEEDPDQRHVTRATVAIVRE